MPFDDISPRGPTPGPDPALPTAMRLAAAAVLALLTSLCFLGTYRIAVAIVAAFATDDIHADPLRAFAGAAALVLWAGTAPYLLALAAGRWP